MKEIKKCSIAGLAFTLDTDAYQTLEQYLEALKKGYKDTPDGAEIVSDIEARIAELILTAQDNTRVVEKPLILNIIKQLGSAEDIAEQSDNDLHHDTPRIPRRLYRDVEGAKLGGVCAGIGKYFDVDPVWIRLGIFLPLILSPVSWFPFMHWAGSMTGNLFAIFVICYLIMWFVVPVARSARQKLEMQGERITEHSIRDTVAASSPDPDSKAKPIVAEAVSVFGKIVLILMKIFAGLIVFGLIMAACGMIIGLAAILVGGHEIAMPAALSGMSLAIPILGILVALIPVILLIYVLMCLIASRKPGGKAILAIFLLWLASIIILSVFALRDNTVQRFRDQRSLVNRMIQQEVIINEEPTESLDELLEKLDQIEDTDSLKAEVKIESPTKQLKIEYDKTSGEAKITSSEGKRISVTVDTGNTQKK